VAKCRGTGGQVFMEWMAKSPWNRWPNARGIRTLKPYRGTFDARLPA
jgi:hypothetical protein